MNIDNNDKKEALVMLSGGRDSFLTICRMIKEGYAVKLITYDNGCMSGEKNTYSLLQRLQKRFGDDIVKSAGIHMIAQDFRKLAKTYFYQDASTIANKYPHLTYNQFICLACHTAMYVHSIAYCLANDINVLAEGARLQQGFFVELPEMKQEYEQLCLSYGIALKLPVYDLDSDEDRKNELASWGFLPKSYELQCWLGCPLKDELSESQRNDLLKYYKEEMHPQCRDMIECLKEKKRFDMNVGEYL